MAPPIISARGLTKRYGRTTALDGFDVEAGAGQVTALLGPNGAGKTTFVRAVATLLELDEGELRVAGFDVRREPQRVRRMIGLAGQHAAVEPALTGRENLVMVARLYGHDRRQARATADALLDRLDLAEAGDRKVRTYSGGMRRRLDLGASLAGAPRLLLLDEPTTGLDPRSRIGLWDAVRELVADGTDVLLTTQYLEEADQLADRLVVIDRGRVVAEGGAAELKRRVGGTVIDVRVRDLADLGRLATLIAGVAGDDVQVHRETHRLTVSAPHGTQTLAAAVAAIGAADIEIDDLALRTPTLDEVFLALTGKAGQSSVDAA